jgi:hypothetical protein
MKLRAPLLVVFPLLLLGGCWQADGSLYDGVKPIQPFRTGQLQSRNAQTKEEGREMLTLGGDGSYRLTNDDHNSSDYGEYYTLRFFALSGTPDGTLVFEAVEPCKPDDRSCTPAKASRYYGLVRRTGQGAEILNPKCPEAGPESRLPGATADKYDTCTFAGRAGMENGLRQLSNTPWTADITYRFTP